MLFCDYNSDVLAISQPAHAWISGQLMRAWAEPLSEPLLLAAEQHDIGWLDWEAAPTFDSETGRPHLFRDVGAATHAPMWTRGVEHALAAWGAHVALLESVRKHHAGLHSFRSMRRMEARRRKASALRLRHSQSLASLRQRPSQARVRSTIQRFGRTTKPLA